MKLINMISLTRYAGLKAPIRPKEISGMSYTSRNLEFIMHCIDLLSTASRESFLSPCPLYPFKVKDGEINQ